MAHPERALRVHMLIDSLNWGGAESLLGDFAEVASTAGISLSVGYLRDFNGSPSADRLRSAGVEPQLLDTGRLLDPRSLVGVRRHLSEIRPDLVHTHLDAADVLGGIAAWSLGIPVVSTLHLISHAVSDDPGLRGAVKREVTAIARRVLDRRVIAVSEAARIAYVARRWSAPRRAVTVRNGIVASSPTRSREQMRADLGIAPDAVVAIMITVLRPGKGHAVALRAVERLRGAHPNLVLLVLGDGPSRSAIERLAAPLGSHVVLTGHRHDVTDLLHAVDVVLHPTEMDALPTSLLQAAAAGLPTVATAVGGIPEVVEHEVTGLLVSEPTTTAVAHELGRLLDDAALRTALGRAARRRFDQEFSAGLWARRMRDLYDGCLIEDRS